MNRELILLSPYKPPTQHPLILNNDDVAAYLHGYVALWHPLVMQGAVHPPRIGSPYDYEQPQEGQVFALPVSPPLYLPDDWEERVQKAGAYFFRATTQRDETLANAYQALSLPDGPKADAAAFYGMGLGYLAIDPLFEAMSHSPQLNVEEFWKRVTAAAHAIDPAERQSNLKAAAEMLREARTILYPANVYFVDLVLLSNVFGQTPLALEVGTPVNFIANGRAWQHWANAASHAITQVKEGIAEERIEVCAGPELERTDALLPLESQLWNLRHGMATSQRILGHDPKIFARRDFGMGPQTPAQLQTLSVSKVVLQEFDDGVIPHFRSASIEWPSTDGRRVDAFTRKPLPANSALTFFHLAHHLYKTMLNDMTACLAFVTDQDPAAKIGEQGGMESASPGDLSFYRDWLELNRLAPVYGQLTTLSRFFVEVAAGEYPATLRADEFHSNYLDRLTTAQAINPISRFRDWTRQRRRLDSAWTLLGLWRGLCRLPWPADAVRTLANIEEAFERGEPFDDGMVGKVENQALEWLAERLLSKAATATPGYLFLNTTPMDRRAAVELADVTTPLPAPAKATQLNPGHARVVIETPPLGFAWLPRNVTPGTKVAMPKGNLAEELRLRNEFFEAEIDADSGGLRVIRDHRRRHGRLGQQLVYQPGSRMQATKTAVTSQGPTLGEIVTEGRLLDPHGSALATFRQRFRAWWAMPWLEVQITIDPVQQPTGYPWHAYYGSRFAWREPKAPIVVATNGIGAPTGQTRPEATDFFELRDGPDRTTVLLGGLPFLQRQGGRMLDVLLIVEGESARTFDLAIALDRDDSAQDAMDWITPGHHLPVGKGPPHVGPSGWLFHVGAANLVLTSLRPDANDRDAVILRLLECRGVATQADLHCPRQPTRATVVDEFDKVLEELTIQGDGMPLYFTPTEMKRIRVEFS